MSLYYLGIFFLYIMKFFPGAFFSNERSGKNPLYKKLFLVQISVLWLIILFSNGMEYTIKKKLGDKEIKCRNTNPLFHLQKLLYSNFFSIFNDFFKGFYQCVTGPCSSLAAPQLRKL